MRTRGEKAEVKKSTPGKKVRFGDKLFVVKEWEDAIEDPEFEDIDDIDAVFSGFDKKNKNLTKKNGKRNTRQSHVH